jgi:hypothetical protein
MYTVYVPLKQWKKVESALQADPEDFLVIEGGCAFDAGLSEVVVYATAVSTRALQASRFKTKQEGEPQS